MTQICWQKRPPLLMLSSTLPTITTALTARARTTLDINAIKAMTAAMAGSGKLFCRDVWIRCVLLLICASFYGQVIASELIYQGNVPQDASTVANCKAKPVIEQVRAPSRACLCCAGYLGDTGSEPVNEEFPVDVANALGLRSQAERVQLLSPYLILQCTTVRPNFLCIGRLL